MKTTRSGGTRPARFGNLTGDWVEAFSPILTGALFAPLASPDTVVIDNLPFHVGRLKDGLPIQSGNLLFHVFGAIAYDVQGEQQVWHLRSAPTNSTAEWEAFLHSAPGVPKHVICDEATGLLRAIPRVWPNAEINICQWHLYDQGPRALTAGGLAHVACSTSI